MTALQEPAVGRFAVLDSWRGLAACMVALFHLRVHSHVDDVGLVRNANLFVDFFFVLSGFVITASYAARLAAGLGIWRFALLRFGRLYPLHLVVLIAFFAAGGSTLAAAGGSLGVGSQLFLLHGIGVIKTPMWGNVPSWSISTEFFVCLVFAATLATLRGRAVWALLAALLVLPATIYATGSGLDVDGYQLVRGLYGFAAGTLAWMVFARARHRVAPGTAGEIAAIATLVLFVSLVGMGRASIFAPAVFAAVVLVFAYEAGAASRILSWKPFLWMGTVSYSVYMVHYFIAGRMAQGLGAASSLGIPVYAYLGVEKWAGDLAVLAYLAAVLAVSAFSYRFVEAPSRAWFRQLAERAEPRSALA